MDDVRTQALVGECISRAHVEAAREATLAQIDEAIAACDYERAATLALGRVRGDHDVPAPVIARILPGIELPAITFALLAICKDRAALLEIIERRRFAQTKDTAELEAIVLYAAWRAGAAVPRVIPELRRLSARSMSAEGYALLATIAATLDDPHATAATKPIAPFAKEHAKQVAADDKALTATIDQVLAELPPEVETARAAGFTVRAGKQVGRNDPCPCGSGLKYKKCCADKQVTPSPVAGLSWEEFLQSERVTSDHVLELPLRDLVRLDAGKLGPEALSTLLSRLVVAREWAHAERVVAAAATHEGPLQHDLRDHLVLALLEGGELERARGHIAQLPESFTKLYELELAIADGPAMAWDTLVRTAGEVVASTDRVPSIELAYSLLRAAPALGIVAARACIGALLVDDPDLLLEAVEDARDRLGIAPTDPAWDVLDALTDKSKHEKADAEAQLKAALGESSARVDQLERMLASLRTELDAARTRPAAELMRAPEEPARLDARVRELEALIREGNAERRELRKQLETAAAAPAESATRREGPRARRLTVEEGDEDVADDVELGQRGITIPRFERRAIDALEDVPAAVAAETMRTIGTLAAGDGFAWRSVKQAKDMARPVLMARVGIHHRVLFRIEDGALDVIDLITREQLLTTLKRLRAR